MKKSRKGLIIGIGGVLLLACVGIVILIFAGKMKNQSAYTVKFELCTELQTTTVLDRTVAPGSFLEEPEVYVTGDNEENWEITGWYREPEYETQWDFDFDTVDKDITLYAKWDTNPQCTINFFVAGADTPTVTKTIRKGMVATPCDEEFMGREVLGYYLDKEMTQKFDFAIEIQKNTDIYVDVSKYVYFDAKMISKWNVCGIQSEVDEYEVSTSLSEDGDILSITSKNGGYLHLSNFKLGLNGTSIIEIKLREVNDNYSGLIGGYILGTYTLNGESGGSTEFGQPNTGVMIFTKSAKPDEDGFYTFTYNISSMNPGLVYDEITGFRLDIIGTDKYTYEIKEIKTYVDPYPVSGEAFIANGIDFTGLHLNTFALMGEADTEVLENEDLRFGGPNGVYIYKNGLEITLGDEQIIRLKAKGELNGGAIALRVFGKYTQDGKAGITTDYNDEHHIIFVAGETDADGYTTYTADLSTLPGLKYQVIHGLRIDLYGEGTRVIDMKSLKSYKPTKEEEEIAKSFKTNGLNLNGKHFTTFLKMGDAEGTLLKNGDYKFGGPNGAYIYKQDVEIKLNDEQIIRLKAKGDLKGGAIALFLYGKYTQNGKAGETTDYDEKHQIIFVPGETDSKGYTTYTADISTIPGLKYQVIHGLRIDLYGEESRTITIKSLKSYEPTKEEEEIVDDFKAKGLDLLGKHFSTFLTMGDAQAALLKNGNYKFGGPNGVFLFKRDVEITLADDQLIKLKAKGDLKGGAIALFLYGKYKQNGKEKVSSDFNDEHQIIFVAGETDAEGYTTYTADISSIPGLTYQVIQGIRLDLYGDNTREIEIQSLKSVGLSDEEIAINAAFNAKGLNLSGMHFTKFLKLGDAQGKMLANKNYQFGGPNGAFIYKRNMQVSLGDDQIIELKAKGDLKGGVVALFLYGEYTQNGTKGVTTDYTAKHQITFVAKETDQEGYTTYIANIEDISGLTYQVIHGLRVDLYGDGTRTIEIQSLKSVVLGELEVSFYVGNDKVYNTFAKKGTVIEQPEEHLVSIGHKVLGYYADRNFKTLYNFNSKIEKQTDIYVEVSDYLYFSPDMLRAFDLIKGPAGDASASVEIEGDSLKMSAVHGTYLYKNGMDLDVSATQVLEFTLSASVDVSLVDIWLFGTYIKDGQSHTIASENLNLRWRIVPDTTGKFKTYTIDLRESLKESGMDWKKITGMRVDMNLHNANGKGIMNIQSIKATERMGIVNENFEAESEWTYEDAAQNTGKIPAQGQEEVVEAAYAYKDTFNNGVSSYTHVRGSGNHVVEKLDGNQVVKITSDTSNWYTLGTTVDGISVKSEESYKFSFKVKSHGNSQALCFVLLVQSWDASGSDWANSGEVIVNVTANSNEWTEVSMEYTVPKNHVNVQLQIQERWSTTYYIDDIEISCGEIQTGTTYTDGIGLCIKNGEATEQDAVLYVKNYVAFATAAEIQAGTTYKYSFVMRNDATGSDFDFDIQADGIKVDDILSGAQSATTWKEVSGTFVASKDAETFGFLRTGEGAVYIDELTLHKITEEESDEPKELVLNGNFSEDNFDYTSLWRVQGGTGLMEIVQDPANAANKALKFAATDANGGVDFNAGDAFGVLKQGKTYTVSFRYKGDAQFHIFTLGLVSAGHTLLDDWIAKSEGDWSTYTFEITPTIDTSTSAMQIYFKMATEIGGTFYIDDFSIVES